jgi:hypothetical protein
MPVPASATAVLLASLPLVENTQRLSGRDDILNAGRVTEHHPVRVRTAHPVRTDDAAF